jgi:AbrB family looped-hinge helix DNA binding protein
MKIGKRGQITIPEKFRERFGLHSSIEVEFVEEQGRLILRKMERDIDPVERVAGSSKTIFKKLGFNTSDDYLEELRER